MEAEEAWFMQKQSKFLWPTVSVSTEVLTAVWTSCLLNGCKTCENILVGRYDVARRNCNTILDAALFRNLIFKFALQAVQIRNYLRVNSHH